MNFGVLLFGVIVIALSGWKLWRLWEHNTRPPLLGQRRVLRGDGPFSFVMVVIIWGLVFFCGLFAIGRSLREYLMAH
jgi:hypothetical protein